VPALVAGESLIDLCPNPAPDSPLLAVLAPSAAAPLTQRSIRDSPATRAGNVFSGALCSRCSGEVSRPSKRDGSVAVWRLKSLVEGQVRSRSLFGSLAPATDVATPQRRVSLPLRIAKSRPGSESVHAGLGPLWVCHEAVAVWRLKSLVEGQVRSRSLFGSLAPATDVATLDGRERARTARRGESGAGFGQRSIRDSPATRAGNVFSGALRDRCALARSLAPLRPRLTLQLWTVVKPHPNICYRARR
jgi:hypothetical protein